MRAVTILMLLWICDHVLLQGLKPMENESIILSSSSGVSTLVIPTRTTLAVNIENNASISIPPTPKEKSAALTMAASGVIIFIAILVLVVIILVSVVSLRFKCRRCKDIDEKQKPQHPMVSYSYSDASADTDIDVAPGKKNIVTLVSMKNLNTNNNKGMMKTVVIHEEQEDICNATSRHSEEI